MIKGELAEIMRTDVSRVFISSSSAPVLDSSGHIVASVSLSIDVTEQITAQRERNELLDRSNESCSSSPMSSRTISRNLCGWS
jgi:hypothetical protein